MEKPLRDAIHARDKNEEQKRTLLNLLARGGKVGELDTFGILRPIARTSMRELRSKVSLSREEGSASQSSSIWLIAPRGGGKSETLDRMESDLLSETYDPNLGKSLVVKIDLKKLGEKTSSGLQTLIFNRAFVNNSSRLKQQIDDLSRYLTRKSPTESLQENVIGLGIDIAATLVKVTVPALSMVGTWASVQGLRRWRLRKGAIVNSLREKGITEPDVVEFLTRWIQYSINPSEKAWRRLSELVEKLANREELLTAFCRILSATGYSTMVVLVDEADEIMTGGKNLTRAFETLWDENGHLNMFFVFAGTSASTGLKNEEIYGGFARRFMGTPTVDFNYQDLTPPRIERKPDPGDDFSHAVSKIQDLVYGLTSYPPPTVAQADLSRLRARLSARPEGRQVTWHDLWVSVAKLYFPV